mmetsp:Transcript_16340/g.55499  ORF Transcript_16340/g.55499 Transcript_16340/m.55499 type:complete len:213 (+) Transcript_16340:599-1237(+)
MAPSMQSPIAYTLGTFVWKCSSTCTRPRRSISMPSSSRPMPFVTGRRPVATSTTSAEMVWASPPAAGSTVSTTPSAVTSEDVTLVLRVNLSPCFLSVRWNCLPISWSIVGTMRSRNSTTSTSVPRRFHTEPISRPMTPPPTTTIFLGISVSSSAPVESTMRLPALSTGHGGRGMGSEPVAMTILSDSTVCEPPSRSSTLMLWGPESRPHPLT